MAIPYGKQIVVNMGHAKESLADFVRRVRSEKGLSLEEVSEKSGNQIGRTHINRIELGNSTNPSPQKLKALARGLGVSEEELFTIVRGNTSSELSLDEMRLLAYYRSYQSWRREEFLSYAEWLSSRDDVPRHPAVTDTPQDVPLPETTPEVLDDEKEGNNWRDGRANGTNGTNGADEK